MRACNQQRLARCNKRFVEIRFVERHVRAVLAMEYQRESIAVFQAEQHERRQALHVCLHVADIAAFTIQCLDKEAAHVVVTDA